ncbi:MAG: LysE family translocator [Proteobacteria bacterium]|nr:LysE family translocator [Pseudomonadota bacterium]MBU1686060.1 LysE family translocator [Pseudomonadota bacterium]
MFNTEFLLTSLIVVLIPGTGVIYTVSTGLFLGKRASIAAAIGCTAGIIPHLTASVLGLSMILHMSAVAFQAVKLVGASYLLYLAWSLWREKGMITFSPSAGDQGFRQIAIRGFLLNILNPKLSIFFLAFLPLFISPNSATPTGEMLMLSLVFMVMTLVIFIVYGLTATGVRKYVVHSPRLLVWLQRSFAVTFAALGANLALTDH